jgi:hypothetical protein
MMLWHIMTWMDNRIVDSDANDVEMWYSFVECTIPRDPDFLQVMLF